MSGLNAAALASLAGWIDDRLANENADRQTICEDAAARLRDMAAAIPTSTPPAAGSGPFETEHDARQSPAVRAVYDAFDADPGAGKMTAPNLRMLLDVIGAAGVQVGEYDHRILLWLARWEPATCAVMAGLIARAHQAGGAR